MIDLMRKKIFCRHLQLLEPRDEFRQAGGGQVLQGLLHGGALYVDGLAVVGLDHHAGEREQVGIGEAT